MTENYKIAIVGAASLMGKELNDALGESSFATADFLLLDDDSTLGQLETVGDEVTFIQRIEPRSFEHVDFTFFTAAGEITRKHWKASLAAGASIVDLSYALEGEADVLVRAPWVREEMGDAVIEPSPDLQTPAIIPAHPVAVALALLLLRVHELGVIRSAWATVLEPASEYGRGALDELHQQTVTLLSFQSLPKEIYDAQVAFNLLPALGEAAKISLAASEARIRRHYGIISAGQLPPVGIQLMHAPVFHGYGISLGVELDQAVTLEHMEAALSGEHIDVVLGDTDPPSNLSVAGQEDVLVRVRTEDGTEQATQKFWIWASLDNLKLAAMNAVACAQELRRLRPQGKVQ